MHRQGIHKPIIGTLVTGALIYANYLVGENTTLDLVTAWIIAIPFLMVSLVILVLTDNWYWRAVAVMVAFGGTGIAFGLVGGRTSSLIWISPLATRAILRGSLQFGGVLLFIFLVQYLIDRRQGKADGPIDYFDPRRYYRQRDRDDA